MLLIEIRLCPKLRPEAIRFSFESKLNYLRKKILPDSEGIMCFVRKKFRLI